MVTRVIQPPKCLISRCFSSTGASSRAGIAFDIDGVLIRGNKVLEEGIEAIRLVREAKLPHIFVTNGGGRQEADKAAQLSRWLNCDVKPDQVILSHTPMKALVEKYGSVPVLVGGPERVLDVAKTYGYKKAIHISQVVKANPHVWPCGDHQHDDPEGDIVDLDSIRAVLYMHDDDNWGRDMQVVSDALLAGMRNRGIQTPLYFSNPDFVYAANHPLPRLAQGAFRDALGTVYKTLSGGVTMKYTSFGKPNAPTYEFAQMAIENQAGGHVDVVYGIGDNPDSDIAGANLKEGWRSVLLRTGVWDGITNPSHEPDEIKDNVLVAVEDILDGKI